MDIEADFVTLVCDAGSEVLKEKGRGEALEGPLLAFLGLLFGWAFRTRVLWHSAPSTLNRTAML